MKEGPTGESRLRNAMTPRGSDVQCPWKVDAVIGHVSPATSPLARQAPCSVQLPWDQRQVPGPWDMCQGLAILVNAHAPQHPHTLSPWRGSSKQESGHTGNVFAKNEPTLLPQKIASLQPPSRELERNAAHLQINNLQWLRRQ